MKSIRNLPIVLLILVGCVTLLSSLHAMSLPPFPTDDDTNAFSGGGGSYSPSLVIPTSGLWLQLFSLSNGEAYLALNHATNKIYEIFSKTNLTLANWNIELEVSPTNATVMPFTVAQSGRANLFLWARDWTGITSHGNTTPEWWFWKYFDTVDLSDTNLESTGENTLLYYYQHGLDPNVIQFSLQFTNTVLNTIPAYGTLAIQLGEPSYIAILINDTNQADAIWQPYSSTNIAVPLSSGNGLYNILVGLRGLPSDARQSWVTAQLTLDNVAPTFAITSPTNSTVSVPMIQLQGLVSASLNTLTYDVSNAAGIFTNQTGYWQPAFYDTNLLAFTTNTFQCYDIALTNGLNTITLYATDLAGNSSTTNFSYTLDYSGDHTAPMLSVIWPTNGTSIAGSNVTVQAQMDDTTATVIATIGTNTLTGLVERSGAVWFNNMPLDSGTNILTVTAVDAAGNMSTTNLTVIQSSVNLTINPLSSGQMNQTNVTVSGMIGDASQKVTVNGVLATVTGTNWTAANVHVSSYGTAGLNVQVGDSSNNLLAVQNVYQPQPAQVVLASYQSQINDNDQTTTFVPLAGRTFFNYGILNIGIYWSYASGGVSHTYDHPFDTEVGPTDDTRNLPAGVNGFFTKWENVDAQSHSEGSDVSAGNPQQFSDSSYNHTQTHVMIQPPGQQSVGQSALYLVQAQVTNEDTGLRLLANAVQFVNQLAGTTTEDVTNDDGTVWSQGMVSAAAGAQNVEVTPLASGFPNINFSRMKLSPAITVFFSIDPNGMMSQFNANNVESLLQSNLNNNVFDSPPASHSVQVKVNVEATPKGKQGWNGNPKTSFFNRVTWDLFVIPSSRAKPGLIQISPETIMEQDSRYTRNVSAQTFVNFFAHEGIWGNAGNNFDCFDIPFIRTCTDGDISAGALNHPAYLYDPFIVTPSSRTTLRKEFGF